MAKLFGSASAEAAARARTPKQWRSTLSRVLDELFRYVEANVSTDEAHWHMILSCFAAAKESLKSEAFWPGYVEAITRLSLLLLGEYPDHRKRTTGKKRADHYVLSRHRTLHFAQSPQQRLNLLFAANALQSVGFPELSVSPRAALSEFREQFGFQATYAQFMRWYRATYPRDYALVF